MRAMATKLAVLQVATTVRARERKVVELRAAAPADVKRPRAGDFVEYLRSVFIEGHVTVPRYMVWTNVGLLCLCVLMLAMLTQK